MDTQKMVSQLQAQGLTPDQIQDIIKLIPELATFILALVSIFNKK